MGLAALAGVVLPAAALGGGVAAVAVGVVILVVSVVWLTATSSRGGFPFLLVLAELGPAVAAASVVAARGQGGSQALTLLVAICLYDMANFLSGTGLRGGVVGALVGMITVAIFAVLVAAVVVPPFSGDSPWILFGTVACLAPAGVFIMGRIGPSLRLPAVRRLDSLLLAGPAWVIAVHLVLH
jgi:hypothetical protein